MGNAGLTYTVACMGPDCRKRTSNLTLWESGRKKTCSIPGWVVDGNSVPGYGQWCSTECHEAWWARRERDR